MIPLTVSRTILSTVKLGLGTISNTMFPAEWARPKDLTDYAYNPEKAKQNRVQ